MDFNDQVSELSLEAFSNIFESGVPSQILRSRVFMRHSLLPCLSAKWMYWVQEHQHSQRNGGFITCNLTSPVEHCSETRATVPPGLRKLSSQLLREEALTLSSHDWTFMRDSLYNCSMAGQLEKVRLLLLRCYLTSWLFKYTEWIRMVLWVWVDVESQAESSESSACKKLTKMGCGCIDELCGEFVQETSFI